MRNQSGELAALDAPDFQMIRADAKYRGGAGAAKIGEIFGLAIEHYPGDFCGCSGAADVGQSGAAYGFEDDRVGMLRGIALNDVQKLLALIDGVVRRVNDLDINAKALRGCFRSSCLLDLEIIIVGDQRYQET